MDYLIVAIVVSALNMACFFLGANIRQKVDAGEKIEVPNLNPMKVYQEKKEKDKEEEEQRKMEKLWHNVEHYNGSSAGQLDL